MWNLKRLTRRELLGAGALPLAASHGLGLGRRAGTEKSCIFLFLVGGPSQLDTWDPKPEAPSEVRGPFRAMATNVSGIRISENFPFMARQADKYAMIRSCHHTGAAVHDIGHQIMQTGSVFEDSVEHPHIGSIFSKATGIANVLLPFAIGNTGGKMPHGQSAGYLGRAFDPVLMNLDVSMESEKARARYGWNSFGQSCLQARRLVESGTRFVTVNMFDTVFGKTTWDIHGHEPFSTIPSYRDRVAPMFDHAYTALLEDLSQRGMLSNTLVVSVGEFGRTPKINMAGGRDHWPYCFTALIAGGGVQGGQVIGSSDSIGAEPRDRPVSPGMLLATMRHALGLPSSHAEPIYELFT